MAAMGKLIRWNDFKDFRVTAVYADPKRVDAKITHFLDAYMQHGDGSGYHLELGLQRGDQIYLRSIFKGRGRQGADRLSPAVHRGGAFRAFYRVLQFHEPRYGAESPPGEGGGYPQDGGGVAGRADRAVHRGSVVVDRGCDHARTGFGGGELSGGLSFIAAAGERPGKNPNMRVVVIHCAVGYNYFRTLGVPVVMGREFSPAYPTDTGAYLINETAMKLMGMTDPVGKNITFFSRTGRIIGVVRDFHFNSLHDPIMPLVVMWERRKVEKCGAAGPILCQIMNTY